MKRRHFIVSASAVGVATALGLRPSDNGAPYNAYFSALNKEFFRHGPHRPAIIVDLDRLDQNINTLISLIRPSVGYRIVAKSLPSPSLLRYIMDTAKTHKLMLFHLPFIQHVAQEFPHSDILLGKPMPVAAVEQFYIQQTQVTSTFKPAIQLQWLVDNTERLQQYLSLAQQRQITLRINIEIDVGLHRGGIQKPDQLKQMLAFTLAHPQHLTFSGLMGYDPHVVKIPSILDSEADAFRQSQAIYQRFIDVIVNDFPQIDLSSLCLNGAGSPTVALHQQGSVINEISAGSCLVKPSDFDIPSLEGFVPASYIATPVLKQSPGIRVPSVESLSPLLSWWDINQQQTFFIYGGEWMAHYESPAGLQKNTLYGKSTNQQMVNGSNAVSLHVDDHVFLRPTQSEAVFLQFGDIVTLRQGSIQDHWSILGND